jgi:stearoyl-CoA desaturase (delta-9 desaturase)
LTTTALDVRSRPPTEADTAGARPPRLQILLTAALVLGPLVALTLALVRLWGHGIHLRDLVLAVALYVVTGFGVTIGFHRLFTHRSFIASRPLKLVLSVAGSLSFQGGVIGWVANHRRHHSFTDRPGDPHSPAEFGHGIIARARGLWHSHSGWFFEHRPNFERRYAPDLLADRDIVVVNALFPVFCVASLAVPFGLGWVLGGTLAAGLTALLWAGLVRVCLLQHVTWSINSVCHTFGRRRFHTRDQSRNFAPLALISMGEAWHNNHHAFPTLARQGVDRGQIDPSAALIRLFAWLRWARQPRWPVADVLARRRITTVPA